MNASINAVSYQHKYLNLMEFFQSFTFANIF